MKGGTPTFFPMVSGKKDVVIRHLDITFGKEADIGLF